MPIHRITTPLFSLTMETEDVGSAEMIRRCRWGPGMGDSPMHWRYRLVEDLARKAFEYLPSSGVLVEDLDEWPSDAESR